MKRTWVYTALIRISIVFLALPGPAEAFGTGAAASRNAYVPGGPAYDRNPD